MSTQFFLVCFRRPVIFECVDIGSGGKPSEVHF
nr:MAG TPA: hypothetical protein [Caudoviricetes sp.]